ncbi:ABC transporter substrate-binding protein [Micromonospora sp. LOL_023]|uniref:ABC transporter substrate-binding protein n=1 Tax=Micromonospora sp. LOL_023 TaxID=3345418 RepID=UPI003A8462CA
MIQVRLAASRRRPRRRSGRDAAILAALTAGSIALAACGSGGETTEAAEEITTLRIDVLSEPSTLDPLSLNDTPAQRVYRMVYDSLFDWNEQTTEVEPQLADALPEVSADGLTYTVPLRDDVTWHSGETFTADDVLFTFEQVRDTDNSSVWASAVSAVADVAKTDDQTVTFTLNNPYTYFPEKLAMVPIVSAAAGYQPNDNLSRDMVGTGPFSFENWQAGEQIRLVRNETYYGGAPALEAIEFHVVPEDTTRVANLRNGTSHIAPELAPALLDLVRDSGQQAEVAAGNVTRVYLYPNMQDGRPTADAEVRQAIAWAVDRKAIIDTVYDGAARSASTYLSYGSRYHVEELGDFYGDGGDTTQAQSHLDEATTAPAEPLNFVVNNLPALVDAAAIIQQSLAAAGIQVEIEPMDFGAMVPRLLDQEYDLLLTTAPVSVTAGFAPDYPAIGLHSESVPNWNRFTDPQMDELLTAAQRAPAGDESAAAWRAVQEYDLVTLGQIQLVSAQYTEGFSKDLTGYTPSNLAWLHNVPTIGTD